MCASRTPSPSRKPAVARQSCQHVSKPWTPFVHRSSTRVQRRPQRAGGEEQECTPVYTRGTICTRYRYSITYSVKGIRTRVTEVPCYRGHGLQVIVTVCIEYSKTHNHTWKQHSHASNKLSGLMKIRRRIQQWIWAFNSTKRNLIPWIQRRRV